MIYPVKLPKIAPLQGELPFCGTSPAGHTLAAGGRYLTYDGKPVFPVSGEFHFARYRRKDWERELCKMKAGGVNLVATYIFWIHHEEEKGVFDFSGQRDLRAFVELCGRVGLGVILRIGPWCHGECRNGGFPDWIRFQTEFACRTDDPTYLFYVRRWFCEMEKQVHGLFFKDGGPIVGVQIENEYRSYAEPDREKRKAHMHTLRKMAEECGFIVPLYTATAWGTATLNELETLPVLGGYADAAWSSKTRELPENAHFLFQPPMNDPTIGCDLKVDDGDFAFDVDINRYPYLTAELGGGMQVTLRRRVVIAAKDTEAISVCMIGSGSAMLGYYMYHGGTNPEGKFSTLEESAKVGAPNTLPVKSYDFQAILGENGEPHESYHLTRRHHLLLAEFGEILAPAVTLIPPESAADPADLTTLRFAVRHNAERDCGFVIVSNHLRKRRLAEHKNVVFRLETAHGTVETPPVTVKNDDMLLLPYRMPLGAAVLEATNATPLCRLGERWFFYTDEEPVYRFSVGSAEIVTLGEADSRRAYRFGDKLYLADCVLYEKDGTLIAEYEKDTEVTVWGERGEPQKFTLFAHRYGGYCEIERESEDVWSVRVEYPPTDAEPMLELDFAGDRAEIFDDAACEHLIADWFTTGLPPKLALWQYGCPERIFVRVHPSVTEGRYFDLPVREGKELCFARLYARFSTPCVG